MKKLQLPLFWVALMGVLAYNVFNSFVVVNQHYAYVENEVLFTEFSLTQEYQIKLEKVKLERQTVLDSLETQVRQKRATLNEGSDEGELLAYKELMVEYTEVNNRFEEQNESLMAQYDGIIWKHLNAYVKSFGDEKGYQMILGVSGKGNVLYADDALNVTEELVQYINEKYEGE